MTRPSSLLALLASLALAGCASEPTAQGESVTLPPHFRNAPADLDASARSVSGDWWTTFNDPTLTRLIEEGLLSSLDVDAAAARLQQAAAGMRAAGAAALPNVGFTGSAARERQSLQDPIARIASQFPGYERTANLYGLNLAASWEIDLFGALAAGRRASRDDAAAAEAGLAGARLTVAAEIAAAFLNVRELSARIAIAKDRERTLGDLNRLVALRYARGVAARLEVDQAASDLASVRSDIPALEAVREAEFNRIDVLIGRAPGAAEAEIGAGPIPRAPAIVGDAPAALLYRRPDVVAAARTLAAADARTAEALADRYPKLTISGLVGVLSGDTANLFSGGSQQSAASAGLIGPILDFGRTGAAIDRARAQAREAKAAYRLTVLRAAGEAENGFSELARRAVQARELDISVAALQRARDASRRAYQGGAVSLIEALDAERRLQASEDSAATARADAARAAVATFRALGGGYGVG